jgi:hypothetical protein
MNQPREAAAVLFTRRGWDRWMQSLPPSLHGRAHACLWGILGAGIAVGVMTWTGMMTRSAGEHVLAIWTVIGLAIYVLSLMWYLLVSRRGSDRKASGA